MIHCPKCNKIYFMDKNDNSFSCIDCNLQANYIPFVGFSNLNYNNYKINKFGQICFNSIEFLFDYKKSISSVKEAFQLLEKYLKNIEFQ